MRLLHSCLVASLVASVLAATASADVTAVKRAGSTVYAGPNISSVFRNAISGGTIIVYTDASTGADMVDDVAFYSANSTTQYQNYGASTTSISGNSALYKFRASQLPGFAGGRINKAELQLYFTAGNTNPPVAQVISRDWSEGNKDGGYPGVAPAAAGASYAHPNGLNTGPNQAADGTPSTGAGSWGIAGNVMFNAGSDVSGVTFGGVYGFNYTGTPFSGDGTYDGTAAFDVTQVVQAWADGTPNYGFHTSVGNIGFVFSEAGGDYQPVLFIDYTRNDVPTAISNLAAGAADWYKVDLTWTAPSDVPSGPVDHYEVRYSTSTITEGNWSAATLAANPPTPANPGEQQAFTVTGLSANTTYYFAVKSFDDTGLVSALSNVVSKLTGPADNTAPASVANLAVAETKPNSITVTWTAPGDDGTSGTAAQYDLRYSTSPINAGNFTGAAQVGGVPAPLAAGNLQSMKVTGLNASTTYYFAIKTADEVPNWSGISNVVSALTLVADNQAPNAITDLGVGSTGIKTASLHWTTPADNGSAGLAGYEVRYSTTQITAANWSSATVAPNPPAPVAQGDPVNMMIAGLSANTTYYFAVKSTDQAVPANTSAISNVVSGTTQPPIQPVVVHNPWLKNDRVADTHNITTMGQTYVNAYTPDGVVAPTTNDDRAINIYNNQKRRFYHWAVEPPSLPGYNIEDPTYNQNIFGWSLCGRHARNACTIVNAAGMIPHLMAISNPWGHWTYQVEYDGATHAFDTMCTQWVWNKATPHKVAGCAEMGADSSILLNAVADGRACPGLLLCGDSITEYQTAMANAQDNGAGSGVVAANWTGNMDLRVGQSFKRTWESWLNQHPPTGGMTPPYHHEANKDWKDTVNFPYWEPYQLTPAQSSAINISYNPTFRRWANGTDTLAPDFRSAGYQAMLYSSANIRTYNDDQLTPDLHVNALDTPAEVVFQIYLPYYITDANVSGLFYRHDTGDVNKVLVSTDGNYYTQVWDNQASGSYQLSNLNLRNWVFGGMTYYVKIQLQASGSITDAGLSNLVIQTTFEHNKGAMAYLDKGTNNLTFTFDNPAELVGSSTTVHIYYKWKEYDGAAWTIDRSYETYTTASPTNFTINVGGTKVPRTEYVLVELVPTPAPDGTAPMPITNLTVSRGGSNCVDLAWTAPGDDWDTGTAASYDLRYSTSLITAANWGSATQVTGEPAPKLAGQAETFQVTGLSPNTTYYFAIKTSDEVPNTSGLSNVASVTTDPTDNTAPAAITNLAAAAGGTAGTINLTWTAPGDDATTGTARTYDIRYSTSLITAANFASATAVANPPTPSPAGTAESFVITGVPTGVLYFFAIKTSDEVPNVSAISNVPSAKSTLGDMWFQNGLNSYSGCQDTYMSKAAETTNYDGLGYMMVCGFSDLATTNRRRAIVKFDLGSLPTNAQITQAKLYVYAYANEQHDPAGGYYGAYRVTTAWSAPSVTWNMPWTVSGGADLEATPDVQVPKQTTTGVWYEFDVTSRVQNFIANPGNNNGWVIRCLNETNHNQDDFYASEFGTVSLRPKLFITDVGNVITTACSPTNAGSVSGAGTYQAGQTCTLTASATGQFVFNHWSGAPVDGSTSNPVSFTVSNSAAITAVFTSTDVTAPAATTNLGTTVGGGTGTVTLSWTSPGDDDNTGTAYAYDVRYSTSLITAANFAGATPVSGIGAPKAAGQAESYTVSGLTNGTLYYFALKTRDEVPNWSGLSNVVSATPVMGDRIFQNGLSGYTAAKDSYMSAGATTTNYGTNSRMSVVGYADQGAANVARGLARFDLTSIPTNTTITRATLYLYAYDAAAVRGSTGYYGAYALTRTFTDTGVTWNTYDGTNAWTVAGGDFNATADGQSAKQATAGVWYAFDVTSRVQQWIATPSANYGWVIRCTDENLHNQDNFYQSDYATDPTLRPKLVVSDMTGFMVSSTASPTAGGTITGAGNFQSGQTCTLTAYPDTSFGFVFDHWSGGPVNGQTTNPVSFSVTGDVTVTAVFQGPAGYIDVSNYAELKNAIQNTAVPGNTIRVHSGTYTMTETDMDLNNSGDPGNPITVIGVGPTRPILTAQAGINVNRGFFFINSADSNWVFENLEFQGLHDAVGANAAATYIQGSNITFRNCKVHDCDQGFSSTTTAANTLVEYCEVYNCNSSVNPGYAHLMYMMSDSLTVRGCYLHNAAYGQCFKTRSNNNLIEYNWMETDGSEGFVAGVASGNSNNSLFRGNVFIKRSASSNQRRIFYVYDTSGSISGTVTMINNTFISALANDIYLVHNTGSAANVVLKNNIFAGPSTNLMEWNVAASQLSGTNNVLKTGMTVPAELANSLLLADPGFVNLAARDLHLQSSSQCISAGQNNPTYLNASGQWVNGSPANEPNKTLTLATRFVDATLDAGAFEYTPPVPSVQFQAASSSGSEATTSVSLPVTLSSSYGSTVTVQYAVTGGSATGGGTDYTLASGMLTFIAGDTSESIPVTINNDALDEDDETLVVTLSSPTNAVLGLNTSHTYTITDDDAGPTVQFVTTSSAGAESVASVNLEVQLSTASGRTVTVNYAATGGTAVSPDDYTIAGTQLTFTPGQTSRSIALTIVDDAIAESNETVVVTLSAPANATLGTNTAYTYTIQDNELPTVRFAATSSSGDEAATPANLAVTLSQSYGGTVTVQYAVTGGSALGGGVDYTLAAGQVQFTSGQTSQNIPITIVNDSLDEDDETIQVTISNPTNALLGANTVHTYTITDNDNAPTVQFATAASSGSESAAAVNLAVQLSAASGKTVTVNYAATGGTATNPDDYTISGTSLTFTPGQTTLNVPVTVVDDTLDEPAETIVVTLSGPANATLGTNTTHTYTINDNEGPPAAVADLATSDPTTGSITLSWTAPGDDGNVGTAATYDIRYSTSTINDGNWAGATQVSGEPTPQAAGTVQSMIVSGLSAGTTYYFAMKTADEVPNWSALSNVASGTTGSAGPLQVGPGKTYATVQAAVNAAVNGDTIEIYPDTYTQSEGWATINKSNLTLRGMGSPRPVLDASGSCLSGKGIFVIDGTNTTVENLEFKNSRNPTDRNAAGIRLQAGGLTVRNCYIHDNDDGILTNDGIGGDILLESSEFDHNGYGTGSSHNIYINPVATLTIRYCYFHDAYAGHEIKSRAAVNYILYNRIGNEGGTGSYEVQAANGGTTYIIGNQIEQSSTSGNSGIINYATEGSSADNHLYVINNTIVNNRSIGTFVYNASTTDALVQNNIFQGPGTVLSGPGTQTSNWATADAALVDAPNYDFHLTAGSTGAIDAGTAPGTGINGFDMVPTLQYVHPCGYQGRPAVGTIDIGGFEFIPPTPTVQFSVASSSGSEATTPANLTVTLSNASSSTVTVEYNVTGGTATEGADYTLPTTPVGGIVALKRSPGLGISTGLASQFVSAINGSTMQVYSGQTMAGETDLYFSLTWAQSNNYRNYGGRDTVQYGNVPIFSKFALASLPGFAGGTVNKAQLRFYYTAGNTGLANTGYIISSDWIEGDKTGDFPGATGGLSAAHPMGYNTGADQNASGGTTPPLQSWANNDYFAIAKDVSTAYVTVTRTGYSGGGDQWGGFAVYDVTAFVQAFASGTAPNYGFCTYDTALNYAVQFSETAKGAEYQPVLCVDYTGAVVANTITFEPGQTSRVIPITVINDTATESNETIQITLSNPANATLGASAVHTYTITDDDVVIPSVQFDQPTSSGSEATTSVSIPVSLSASATQVVTVDYAVTGGSASGGGTDYTLAAGQLTFNPTVTAQSVPVTINNDLLNEDDETIVITLSSPANATLGANATHTYTIADDDAAPTVAFSTTSSSGSEATTAVNLAVTLSAASGKTITVSYAATGGTATSPDDYTISGTALTFSPGTTTQNVPVTVVNDTTGEYGETIQVTLSNPTNASLGTNTAHTYTITDNDVMDCTATAENTTYGTVTGTFADTLTSNNGYETLREVLRPGGSYNYSWMEHRWTFSVRGGSSIQFRVEAYRPSNSDSDNFTFAYSTNGTTYTNMVTVSKTSDDNTDQTYSLPAGTSGTVYVRVVDTNRTKNRASLDYLYVDHLVIRSNP